jgi:hypothetical protein
LLRLLGGQASLWQRNGSSAGQPIYGLFVHFHEILISTFFPQIYIPRKCGLPHCKPTNLLKTIGPIAWQRAPQSRPLCLSEQVMPLRYRRRTLLSHRGTAIPSTLLRRAVAPGGGGTRTNRQDSVYRLAAPRWTSSARADRTVVGGLFPQCVASPVRKRRIKSFVRSDRSTCSGLRCSVE